MPHTPALLILDDGTCFEGQAFGARREAAGEVVFTTSMAGYQETLSDPSYCGQIVTFTFPHLGNYGVTSLDRQSRPKTKYPSAGGIFHELFIPESTPFPHWRAEQSLDQSLAQAGITVISGIDTRALTLHLRDHGSRNGIISALDNDRASLTRRARALPSMQGQDLTGRVTCPSPYLYTPPSPHAALAPFVPKNDSPLPLSQHSGNGPEHTRGRIPVAVYDFGIKDAMLQCLHAVGMAPTVWPAATNARTVLESNPWGVLLSNGPGDPGACGHAVNAAKFLLGRVPIFGICLGHQILAQALGAATYKLKFGHHGANHPVKDLESGRVLVTSQNHGFCVDPETLPGNTRISHWNLNDDTLEGFACDEHAAFAVQFHPEAAPGPHDSLPLFTRFRELTERFHQRG